MVICFLSMLEDKSAVLRSCRWMCGSGQEVSRECGGYAYAEKFFARLRRSARTERPRPTCLPLERPHDRAAALYFGSAGPHPQGKRQDPAPASRGRKNRASPRSNHDKFGRICGQPVQKVCFTWVQD